MKDLQKVRGESLVWKWCAPTKVLECAHILLEFSGTKMTCQVPKGNINSWQIVLWEHRFASIRQQHRVPGDLAPAPLGPASPVWLGNSTHPGERKSKDEQSQSSSFFAGRLSRNNFITTLYGDLRDYLENNQIFWVIITHHKHNKTSTGLCLPVISEAYWWWMHLIQVRI